MHPSELVSRFLDSIGRRTEADYYVSLFRAQREQFATIYVDSNAVHDAAGALAVDLRFLRMLDLTPVLAFDSVADTDFFHSRLAPDLPVEKSSPSEAAASLARGNIPLVALNGEELADLVVKLYSRKVVMLGLRSGLVLADGSVPQWVDITREYAGLLEDDVLAPEQSRKLAQARRIVEATGGNVAITSPLDLLRELFTVRGAGTLVRRGATVTRAPSADTVDRERLATLVVSAFGKPLPDDFLERPISDVYIADDYRGAAIVTPTELAPYLSKFAVDVAARGEGIGRDLWRSLTSDHPVLFWRCRAENPVRSWYEQQCDGLSREEEWHVFWRGLPHDAIPRAINLALAQPRDFQNTERSTVDG